ncbi:hypothetical protein JCM1840_004905 [Sporobolomyces johnsonii]
MGASQGSESYSTTGRASPSSIPRLTGHDNLETWRSALQMTLLPYKAWSVVTGTEPKPTELEEQDAEITYWHDRDEIGQQFIGLSVNPSLYVHIRSLSTSADMYKAFTSVLETGSRLSARPKLLGRLWSTKYEEGQDMQTHLNALADIKLKLENTGKGINDEDYASAILWSLSDVKNKAWKRTVISLEDRPSSELTSSLVISHLLDEYSTQQRTSSMSKPRTSATLHLQEEDSGQRNFGSGTVSGMSRYSLKRISANISLPGQGPRHSVAGNASQAPTAPITHINLPVPTLAVIPASPQISYDSDFVPVPISAEPEKEGVRNDFYGGVYEPTEKHDLPNASSDTLPLSSAPDGSQLPSTPQATAGSGRRSRYRSFPRFLHPDHLPPLASPPSASALHSRSRKSKIVVAVRLLLVLLIVGVAIGLGVGLSKPNQAATSDAKGGIAPNAVQSASTPPQSISTDSLAVTSFTDSASTSSSATPAVATVRKGLPLPKGVGGVLAHKSGGVGTSTARRRRQLRQFGAGTVAGWR